MKFIDGFDGPEYFSVEDIISDINKQVRAVCDDTQFELRHLDAEDYEWVSAAFGNQGFNVKVESDVYRLNLRSEFYSNVKPFDVHKFKVHTKPMVIGIDREDRNWIYVISSILYDDTYGDEYIKECYCHDDLAREIKKLIQDHRIQNTLKSARKK